MQTGLVGTKIGMTTLFVEGVAVPVTAILVEPNRVTQLKTEETDGYSAIQVTTGQKKASRVNKPAAGHFAKAGTEAGKVLREFRVSADDMAELKLGDALTVSTVFKEGVLVDVTGTSKGKGFAGVVKRHNFGMQDATHGNSLSHRAHGSTGQCQDPGRVFKGKKMAGQMGNVRSTAQSLQLVRIDEERNLLLIKGAVPGANGSNVIVKPAMKAKSVAVEGDK